VVGAAHERMRLDQFVAAALAPEHSRSQAARMIKAGLITLNQAEARAASILHQGDLIEIAQPPAPARISAPVDAPELDVIYEDDELIVVNKPAGLTVHHAPGHPDSTLVDGLLARFPELAELAEPDGVIRPGIVHRLDKDTSGVMVVARTAFARASLSRQFKERTVRKFYVAIAQGRIAPDRLTIRRPVGRHPVDRKRMSVNSRAPRDAVSHLTVLHRFDHATMVGVRPETGRTHQIRVHLSSIGHPCLDDAVYGGRIANTSIGRQALHACALSVNHPRTGAVMEFVAPLAPEIQGWLCANGLDSGETLVVAWIDLGKYFRSTPV
jgi:23S rRNA pseudouridine1911/1915/1917 synthase